MTVMSSSLTSAPSIVRPSSIVRQITSATGQAEQVDFMVSLGCENGSLNSSIFYPRLTYFPTSPRRENTPPRTLKTEEPEISTSHLAFVLPGLCHLSPTTGACAPKRRRIRARPPHV